MFSRSVNNIPYIEHLGMMVLLLMVKEIRLTDQLRLVVFVFLHVRWSFRISSINSIIK